MLPKSKYYIVLLCCFIVVACANGGLKSQLTVSATGQLYLAETQYSLAPNTRGKFSLFLNEIENDQNENGAAPGLSKIIEYEVKNKPVFDVEISQGSIYRIVLYSPSIKIKLGANSYHVGSNIRTLIEQNQCTFNVGDEMGVFIICGQVSHIVFYTECEQNAIDNSCIINRVLLNNY